MTQCRALTVSSGGTWSPFQGTNTTAFSIVDNAPLFGIGADAPGVHAQYHYDPAALGSSGIGGTFPAAIGGNFLVAHFATGAPATSTPAAIGAGRYNQPSGTATSTFYTQGVVQAQGTGFYGISMYLDLVNVGTNANIWYPAGFYADASATSETPPASSTDTAGLTPRALWVWATVTSGGGTVSTVPTPQVSWTAPITSAFMNGPSGPVQALTLLNNPPALRVSQPLTTSISSGTATTVPFTAAGTIDTYSAFGTATSTYTAPLNGLYLVFPTITFASNSSGSRYAGLSVTAGGTTTTTTFSTPGSGNWTAPAGVTSVNVQCWGAGGAGGAGGEGGGGGGEYASETTYTVVPGNIYPYTVGAGGTVSSSGNYFSAIPGVAYPGAVWPGYPGIAGGGGSGGNGGNTTFNSTGVVAHGGGVGSGGGGGAGGAGSGNSIHFGGGPGGAGDSTAGGGGGSSAGSTGSGNAGAAASGATPGSGGPAPTGGAAGGGGGVSGVSGTAGSAPGGGGGGSGAGNAVSPAGGGGQISLTYAAVVSQPIQGPAYAASGAGAMSVTSVRVLDLQAGNTVQATAFQSSGGTLNLGGATWSSRLAVLYLCPYSSGGISSFTPPQTGFHWTAGIPATAIQSLLNQHLGNDLNFLVNRPYFTGYQATAQTGLTVGAWTPVTIDTVGGLVNGVLGDNYGGWSAYSNAYVAQQPGWYLVIAEIYAALPSLTPGYLSAGFYLPP